MLAVLEWLSELAQTFYWSFWISGPHLAFCQSVDDAYFSIFDFLHRGKMSSCNHPLMTFTFTSSIFVLLVVVFLMIKYFYDQAEIAHRLEQDKQKEENIKRSRALAVEQQREREVEIQNQRYQEALKREVAQQRAAERLPEIERICLREWGHFKARNDPLDMKDLDTVRREFAPVFLKKYPTDAPLLTLSNNVEVRAILTPSLTSWPRLRLE